MSLTTSEIGQLHLFFTVEIYPYDGNILIAEGITCFDFTDLPLFSVYAHTLSFSLHLLQADDQGLNQLELVGSDQAEAGKVLSCSLLGKACSQD